MALIRGILVLCAALAAAGAAQAQIALRGAQQASLAAGGAIAFVADNHAGVNGTSVTVTRPGAVVVNRLMIAQVAVKGSAVPITALAGWTLLNSSTTATGGQQFTQAVYWKRMAATEPANYTWSWTDTRRAAAGIVSYDGVDTVGNPIDAWAVQTTNNNATITMPSVITLAPSSWILALAGSSRASTHSTPAGMTERYDQNSVGGAGGVTVSQSTQLIAAPGATGPRTSTIAGGARDNIGHMLALRPLGALTIGVPAGTLAGDVMIGNITVRPCSNVSGGACTVTIVPPAGWTQVNSVTDQTTGAGTGGFGNRLFVYRRSSPGGEPSSYTWSFGGAPLHAGAAGGILSYSGVDAASPIVAEAGQATPSSTSHAAPSINTGTVTNTMLVSSHSANSSAAWTPPAGMTERVDAATLPVPNDLGLAIEVNDQLFAGSGATGTRTASWTAPPAADTGIAHMLALRPLPSLNHYSISHAGSGVACDTHQITISAHDAAHTPVDAGAALVNLSTSNARGTWTGIAAGGGTLTDATAGDGAATYQFAVGSNSVTLAFRYANLAATSETFSFNVSGGGFSETTGTASGSDDPAFTMAQAGFRFNNVTDGNTTIPVQLSGKPSDTGFNAKTIRIQAIRTDTATGSCAGLFASQTRSVDLGAECNSPAACAGAQASVNGGSIATSNDNGGAGAAAYTSVSLAFNAASEADTVIRYPDAGQISLHARYDLDPGVAGFEAIGSSNAFIVRPFGLAFRGANAATPIQHSSTAAGTLLAPAGDNFTMTVAAYQWAAGEDGNSDGVPDAGVNITDNGSVPNFSATASVTPAANLPGVALGALSRGAGCAGAATIALTGGAGTAADWCYSEAGNVRLSASVANYLAPGVNVAGDSGLDGDPNGGYVGRFKPKHFAVSGSPTLVNRSSLSCAPAAGFTYLGERLSLGFALQAQNAQNAVTQNYTGAYAKLDLTTAASLGVGARSGATNLTGRVDSALAPSGSFANGVAALVVPIAVRRASPDNPDGPFAGTQFGIAPNDSDPDAAGGVQMDTLNLDVDGNAVNDHYAVGPTTELRFGRLRLQNAYAPDNFGVQVPLDLQYWNGSGFTLNAQDGCTSLARENIALSFSGTIAACNTAVVEPSLAFASGRSTLTLSAPGAGNKGTVTLTPQLGTAAGTYCPAPGGGTAAATASSAGYLLGRWDDAANPDGDATTAYDDKPMGRATFGLYGSQPKNFIFFRENY